MKITEVTAKKVNSNNRMKGVASVIFDNCFVVHNIKIIESDRGLFIAMPSIKNNDGTFRDVAHPINSETREEITNAVLEAYNNL